LDAIMLTNTNKLITIGRRGRIINNEFQNGNNNK
jgi:hypothetical protein